MLKYVDKEKNVWELRYPLLRLHGAPNFLHAQRQADGRWVALYESQIEGYMSNIPFHKSERSFRRFETHIDVIVKNLPRKPVAFSIGKLSTQTMLCRLRDAMTSLLEYKWKSYVDVKTLDKLWNRENRLIEVVPGPDDTVVVQEKGTSHKELATPGPEIATAQLKQGQFGFDLDNPPLNVLEAMATLHSFRVIEQPTKIKNVPRKVLDDLAARFDIVISEEHNHYVMF